MEDVLFHKWLIIAYNPFNQLSSCNPLLRILKHYISQISLYQSYNNVRCNKLRKLFFPLMLYIQSQNESSRSCQHVSIDSWQMAQNITFRGSSPLYKSTVTPQTLKSWVDQTICAFSTDCFPTAANPRDPLYPKCTLIHLEALISGISGEGLCLNMDVHFDWPVPLDLFHTYTYPFRVFTTTLGSSPWPHPHRPRFSKEKNAEETRVWGNVFREGWLK